MRQSEAEAEWENGEEEEWENGKEGQWERECVCVSKSWSKGEWEY